MSSCEILVNQVPGSVQTNKADHRNAFSRFYGSEYRQRYADGHDQHNREPSLWYQNTHQTSEPQERWPHGVAWSASAFLATKKKFRRILDYRDLWMLKTRLDDIAVDTGKNAT